MPPRPETARRRICRSRPSISRPGFRSRTSRTAAVPSLTAAIAGEVQIVFSDSVPAMPQIRDNRLTALGLTALRRARIAPDIPTLDESGLPGFSITAWIGVVAPKGTPNEIVQKLNLEIGRALKDPEFARQMSTMGV